MFKPMKNFDQLKTAYTFGVPTFYSDFHLGVDFSVPIGTPILAHGNCIVSKYIGNEGGKTLHVVDEWGKLVRHLHCDETKEGTFKNGDIIGYSGNTGLSKGPHVHTDVSLNGKLELDNLNNFFDPMLYFRNPYKVLIIANRSPWIKAQDLQPVREWFPIRINFDVKHVSINVPITNNTINESWWISNVLPLGEDKYDCIIFVLPTDMWNIEGKTGFELDRFYQNKVKRIDMKADENGKRTKNWGWQDNNELVGRIRHELAHVFYDIVGEPKEEKVHTFENEKQIEKVLKDIPWGKIKDTKPLNEEKFMANQFVRVIKDENSAAVGFWIPAISEATIKNMALIYNKDVPKREDGSIDWDKFIEGTCILEEPIIQ